MAAVVLHLITGILKEIAAEPLEEFHDFLQSTLECLQNLCSNSMAKNTICKKDWVSLLQSGLAHVTQFSKTSESIVFSI